MYLAFFHQIDACQGISSGILRGLGKTTHASVAGGISYWLVSLPMEYLWAFKLEYGLMGLWYGQTFGGLTHASI
jgi:multidrug resistance protein, MATE family